MDSGGSSLDDFFKSRDKKRPKGGKKFATADDATKQLENKARERKKQETLKSTYVAPLNDAGEAPPPINEYRQPENEDDEWKEIVEVQPDFSNLKIQELVLEDDDDFGGKESEGREDADSDLKEGPWNKQKVKDEPKTETQQPSDSVSDISQATPDSTAATTTSETTTAAAASNEDDSVESSDNKVPTSEVEPKKTGGYVPPNRRREAEAAASGGGGGGGGSSVAASSSSDAPKGAYVPPSRRAGGAATVTVSSTRPKKTTTAPNIDNEESFPSLGS